MEITKEDREAAEWLYNNIPVRLPSWNALIPADRAAMAHNACRIRIASEQAVLAKLRDLPDDVIANAILLVDKLPRVVTNEEAIKLTAAALADAIEGKQP